MFGFGKNKEGKEETTEVIEKKAEEATELSIDLSKVNDKEETSCNCGNDECKHEHSETKGVKEEAKEEDQRKYYIGRNEMKALKRSKYDQTKDKFSKSFVIENIKTGMIVEINASSSLHAANIVGWKKNHVRLIEEKAIEPKKEEKPEEAKTENTPSEPKAE